MTKCIIIENELEASNFLESIIEVLGSEFKIIEVTKTIKESILLIKKVSPDIIFLDIELDDGLGFEILEHFKDPSFEVIFITASNNYYQKAFEHFALSYITKPYRPIDLKKVLDHYSKKRNISKSKITSLQDFLKKNDPRILVFNGKEHISILVKDILYCKSEGNHTHVYTRNTSNPKILVNHSLIYFENLLSSKGFFRPSRFYLLNINHIKSIYKKDYIMLSNSKKIKVSIRNRDHLTQLIETLKQ